MQHTWKLEVSWTTNGPHWMRFVHNVLFIYNISFCIYSTLLRSSSTFHYNHEGVFLFESESSSFSDMIRCFHRRPKRNKWFSFTAEKQGGNKTDQTWAPPVLKQRKLQYNIKDTDLNHHTKQFELAGHSVGCMFQALNWRGRFTFPHSFLPLGSERPRQRHSNPSLP